MKFEEAYYNYLTLAESNGTTGTVATDKGAFVLLFNIAKLKLIEWLRDSPSDESRYLQQIKVPFTTLHNKVVKDIYDSYTLPDDYFDSIDLRVFGSSGVCKNQELKAVEIKGENFHQKYNDPNLEPSFKFRETFYTVGDGAMQVYKKGFDLGKVQLHYYRYPQVIALEDPDNPESQFLDEEFEFDDKFINRVIMMTLSLHSLSTDDPKYQAFKTETVQKF